MKLLLLLLVNFLSFSLWAGTFTVSGVIQWTDGNGGIHPARFVHVNVMDAETIGAPRRLATISTGVDGKYKATINNDDGLGGGTVDLFVEVLSNTFIFKLGAGHFDAMKNWNFYKMTSPLSHNVPDNSNHVLNFKTTGNTNGAMSIIQAQIEPLIHGNKMGLVHGTSAGANYMRTIFPANRTEYLFQTSTIKIAAGDEYKWDDVIHEYAHHLAHMNTIELFPGDHKLNLNLSDLHRKDGGNKLALSEGFASWFAVVTEKEERTAVLKIPGTGDINWSERFELDQNDENYRHSRFGEDNEVAVARILWDLYDSTNDEKDVVTIAEVKLLEMLKGSTNLSDFWGKLVGGVNLKRKIDFAQIFVNHGVSPLVNPDGTSARVLQPEAVINWRAQGTMTAYHLDEFKVLIADKGLNEVVYTIVVDPATTKACSKRGYIGDNPLCTYKFSEVDVARIKYALAKKGYSDTDFNWLIEGRNFAYAPETGQYLSTPVPMTTASIARTYIDPAKYKTLLAYVKEVGELERWGQYTGLYYSEHYQGILATGPEGNQVLILPIQ